MKLTKTQQEIMGELNGINSYPIISSQKRLWAAAQTLSTLGLVDLKVVDCGRYSMAYVTLKGVK